MCYSIAIVPVWTGLGEDRFERHQFNSKLLLERQLKVKLIGELKYIIY